MKKKEINGGIVMKCFKRLTACIIATALCVSSSGTIFALSDNDKKDISDKFSDYLLEKYNVQMHINSLESSPFLFKKISVYNQHQKYESVSCLRQLIIVSCSNAA